MKKLIAVFIIGCLLAAFPVHSTGQQDANGSVDTTGITVTIATGTGTIPTISITSFTLINDTSSSNNILICMDATDVSAGCTFELQPGEQFSVDGSEAIRMTKIHFEADAGTADYRWIATW